VTDAADAGEPTPAGGPGADFKPRGGLVGFFVMVLGMFMAILDIQIVASSLPEIQAGVSASLEEVTWVQTAYLVAEVVMIPLSGWLAQVFSSRWLFAASAAGFTVTSVACAFSWDITSLIVFRAAQGFIGGGMIPTVFAAIYKLLPPRRRMLGTVIVGLTATVAPAAGPTIGGWITENFSWHWLFLANVVPGLFVTIAVPTLVDMDRPNLKLLGHIDLIGIALVAGFLGSLEYVLDEGPREDWFANDTILTFAIVSAVSGVLLIWRERVAEHPVIDFRVFANRNFALGCVLVSIVGMCLYGQTFILPQILSQVRGYNSMQIGHVMFVTGAAMFCTAPIAGRISHALDPRMPLFLGFFLVATGLWLNAQMTVEVGFDQLLAPQIVRGVGLMMCIVPITSTALGTMDHHLVSIGSGLFNVFRNMGGAVALSMINTQWDARYDLHYWRLAESMPAGRPESEAFIQGVQDRMAQFWPQLGNTDLASYAAAARTVAQQANIMAWNDIFFMLSVAFVIFAPLILLQAKPSGGDGGGGH
jgi:DHA2 family multidrug resistance protein